ncbi:MAG: PIN domain-containing protein [Caulobacteraceae bacterium]|nr:PIN domain-containing protein [Caulobacteraceae bacterium]
MILVDTSVWVNHLRTGDTALVGLLNSGRVLIHPMVIGEIALGNLKGRDTILGALSNLPRTQAATDDEVLGFIEQEGLHGLGIGYVDAHLLAAVRLTPGAALWTYDRRLDNLARRMSLSAKPAV